MSTNPIVLGQIIAQQPESVSATGQTAPTGAESQGQGQVYVAGQVLQARVAALLSGQQLLLDIGGARLEASGLSGLVQGQTLTVRVAGLEPSLVLEVLAERTPAEQHLATALKNLFSGNQAGTKLWTDLQSAIQQLQALPQSARPAVPDTLLNTILQKLQPLASGQNPTTISAADVRSALSNIGLEVESALRSTAGSAGQVIVSPELADGLKPLLGRLIAALQQFTSTTTRETGPVPAPETPLPQATVERVLSAVDRVIERIERAVEGNVQRAEDLSVLRALRSRITPEIARRILPALQAARSSLGALAKGGAEQLSRLRTALETLRHPLPANAVSGETRVAENVRGEMARLATDIEAILNRNTEGRALLQRMLLSDASRATQGAHERIEAFQVLNSHLGERSQQLHLFLPVAFADEITEMQFKQFSGKGDGSKGKNETLTVVMLLQLESLGTLRIDTLAQEKTLYVNIFVERPEIKPVVEELAADFGKQLQARGLALARLVCQADEKKIKEFHTLGGDVLADDEGLVDMKI